jgi:hypothetical protein
MMKHILIKSLLLSFLVITFPIQNANACEWYEVFGCDDDDGGGGGVIDDPFDGLDDWLDDLGDDMSDLGNDVADGFESIPGFIDDLYFDVLSIVNGVDPNLVASVIITEFQNENNCKDLPSRLDEVSHLVLEQSGVYNLNIPSNIKNAISAVNFSGLEIIGIDPEAATSEDLYYYKITTVKPLETMKGITGSIFKIPFVIGTEIANACANAAEFRIAQRDSIANLKSEIHRALSSNGINNIQFLLPSTEGGNLEDVGSLVEEVIETYEEMDVPISNGVRHTMMKAERYFEMEQYHRAFKSYRSAYKSLSGSRAK